MTAPMVKGGVAVGCRFTGAWVAFTAMAAQVAPSQKAF